MRALDPEVGDAVWAAIVPLIPPPDRTHPLGCHRPRASDRDCFDGMLVRLVTGCSWEDAERLCGHRVSDTTMRSRRDEWIAAGVFISLEREAQHAYDKIIGLDLSDVSVDGSLHKSPCGGEGTGKNPTDRGKLGWKWSILTDLNGIPFGVAIDGANRNDSVMLAPTLDDAGARGLLGDIETIWLDRGYDSNVTLERLKERHLSDAVIAKRRKRGCHRGEEEPADGTALAGRADQLVALELRTAPQEHRPQEHPPTRSALAGHRVPADGQAHRLAEPLVTGTVTYPLRF